MSELSDTRRACDAIHAEWARQKQQAPGIALLHCVVSYPTEPQDANLAAIGALTQLDETVGYSDHTLGIEAAVAAVAMGARLIEKHFTIDKNQSDFRDHKLSADPAELAELVRRIRAVETMRGKPEKTVVDAERAAVAAVRRGAYAARDLSAGARLDARDVLYLRPRAGLSPADVDGRIGQALVKPAKAGEPFTHEHFA